MRAYELRKELKLELADFKEILEKLNIKIKYQTKNLTKEECEKINDFLNPAIKIEDTIKEKFSQLQTLKDFVEILNILGKNEHGRNHKIIKAKQLTYYAYHCKDKYDIFEIPKKSGGTRKIYAPKKALKNILRSLNIALHIHYKKNISAHGFLKNRSVATNAKKTYREKLCPKYRSRKLFSKYSSSKNMETYTKIAFKFKSKFGKFGSKFGLFSARRYN